MYSSTVMATFHTIRKNPGLNIKGVADAIRKTYGDKFADFFVYEDDDYESVKSRIKDINCVECINDKYYFNSNINPRSQDDVINGYIEGFLTKHTSSD